MVFVTGGTGYLGMHVLYELIRHNTPVKALYRDNSKLETVKRIFKLYSPDEPFLFEKIQWIKGDVLDYAGLMNILCGVTSVYHTAGYVSFDDKDSRQLNKVNIQGTSNIVNACLESGNIRLCHVSSIAALGELAENIPVSEEVIWNQGTSASAYAISKFKGEMEVWRGIHEGLNAVIVNPSVLTGPAMWIGPGKDLFESSARSLPFYPKGSAGYVDVRDVAKIMVLLTQRAFAGERFILNAENMEHRRFMTLLATALGKRGPERPLTPFLIRIAVILETLRSYVTGSKRRISSRSMKIANDKVSYSNKKVRDALSFHFISVADSVKAAADSYAEFY